MNSSNTIFLTWSSHSLWIFSQSHHHRRQIDGEVEDPNVPFLWLFVVCEMVEELAGVHLAKVFEGPAVAKAARARRKLPCSFCFSDQSGTSGYHKGNWTRCKRYWHHWYSWERYTLHHHTTTIIVRQRYDQLWSCREPRTPGVDRQFGYKCTVLPTCTREKILISCNTLHKISSMYEVVALVMECLCILKLSWNSRLT